MESSEKQIGWIEEIAKNCQCEQNVVKELLDKYNIRQSPIIGRPRRLLIENISFSGTKKGEFTNDFNFSFKKLKPGIWGILSDQNLRGKTTILEVMKWLLRGKASDLLQEGIRSWIKKCQLNFKLDDKCYCVKLTQANGQIEGNLNLLDTESECSISQFGSNDDFENCMSEFMLKELSLSEFTAFRCSSNNEQTGKTIKHNWASLASALFISTNYSSLFGDITMDGLSNRLMNMYLGLPWVSTYFALNTLEKQINSDQNVEKSHDYIESNRRKVRHDGIVNELNEKKQKLLSYHDSDKIRLNLRIFREKYRETNQQLTSLDQQLRKLSNELQEAIEINQSDKIKLNNFKEDRAANIIFKRLNPTCCPHCEKEISKEKISKEKKNHICSVCDEPLLDSDDSEATIKELQSNFEFSESSFNKISKEYSVKKAIHDSLTQELISTEKQIEIQELSLKNNSQRDQLEKEILRLQILAEEYSSTVIPTLYESKGKEEYSDIKIIKKALVVTKKRFEELQKDLLEEVSTEILKMSKLVGLNQIQSIELTSVPSLKILKDGGSTSYSKCSAGEKLRLKVITTIALLAVAERKNVGRHPGILLIDSPAAQEVSDEDLNSLIQGLENLKKELPFLQIIIASRASSVILDHIDKDQRKHAIGNNYLW